MNTLIATLTALTLLGPAASKQKPGAPRPKKSSVVSPVLEDLGAAQALAWQEIESGRASASVPFTKEYTLTIAEKGAEPPASKKKAAESGEEKGPSNPYELLAHMQTRGHGFVGITHAPLTSGKRFKVAQKAIFEQVAAKDYAWAAQNGYYFEVEHNGQTQSDGHLDPYPEDFHFTVKATRVTDSNQTAAMAAWKDAEAAGVDMKAVKLAGVDTAQFGTEGYSLKVGPEVVKDRPFSTKDFFVNAVADRKTAQVVTSGDANVAQRVKDEAASLYSDRVGSDFVQYLRDAAQFAGPSVKATAIKLMQGVGLGLGGGMVAPDAAHALWTTATTPSGMLASALGGIYLLWKGTSSSFQQLARDIDGNRKKNNDDKTTIFNLAADRAIQEIGAPGRAKGRYELYQKYAAAVRDYEEAGKPRKLVPDTYAQWSKNMAPIFDDMKTTYADLVEKQEAKAKVHRQVAAAGRAKAQSSKSALAAN